MAYDLGLDIILCYHKIKLSCHSMAYQIRIAATRKMRACLVKMELFRRATVSAVKRTFPPV